MNSNFCYFKEKKANDNNFYYFKEKKKLMIITFILNMIFFSIKRSISMLGTAFLYLLRIQFRPRTSLFQISIIKQNIYVSIHITNKYTRCLLKSISLQLTDESSYQISIKETDSKVLRGFQ